MYSFLSDKTTSQVGRLYICTKLSVISPDLSTYKNKEYQKIASDGLNTGQEKYLFKDKESALPLLLKKGTLWCIYEMQIEKQLMIRSADTSAILPRDYHFNPEEIKEIHFHPLFQPEDSAQKGKRVIIS